LGHDGLIIAQASFKVRRIGPMRGASASSEIRLGYKIQFVKSGAPRLVFNLVISRRLQ
jgi:hypothetical protein